MDSRLREGRAPPGSGRVVRVSGPLVEIEGLADVAMSELVGLGGHSLPGEVVAIRGTDVTVQAYASQKLSATSATPAAVEARHGSKVQACGQTAAIRHFNQVSE